MISLIKCQSTSGIRRFIAVCLPLRVSYQLNELVVSGGGTEIQISNKHNKNQQAVIRFGSLAPANIFQIIQRLVFPAAQPVTALAPASPE
jgi:hypothetical protein